RLVLTVPTVIALAPLVGERRDDVDTRLARERESAVESGPVAKPRPLRRRERLEEPCAHDHLTVPECVEGGSEFGIGACLATAPVAVRVVDVHPGELERPTGEAEMRGILGFEGTRG